MYLRWGNHKSLKKLVVENVEINVVESYVIRTLEGNEYCQGSIVINKRASIRIYQLKKNIL